MLVYILRRNLNFQKLFHRFNDLGLHLDLCENESSGTFVAKAGFFKCKNLSKKLQIFCKLKMCNKVLSSIYTLKQNCVS